MSVEALVEPAVALRAPLVAVCVCTRARPVMARRCLEALRSQQIPSSKFRARIFVVDNDPAQSAHDVFDDVFGGDRSGSLLSCVLAGIPIARNVALDAALAAGADYIAFIDDDEVAPEAWLKTLFGAMERSGADVVQGGVRKVATDTQMQHLLSEPLDANPGIEPVETVATCNVLFKAWIAKALRFDENMRFTGGSDRDYFMRANRIGAKVVKVRGAHVIEEVARGRETLGYECMRAFAAGNNYQLRMTKNEPLLTAFRRIVFRALDRGVSGALKVAFAGVLALLLQHRSAYKQLKRGAAAVSFTVGCISPLLGLRAHPYRVVQGA